MSIRPVLTWPDERLRKRAEPVFAMHLEAGLVADLFDTLYAAQGRGLAAPQLGASLRAFVIDAGWKDGAPEPMLFLNPELIAKSKHMTEAEERCLSLPDLPVTVARAERITLRYQDTGFDWHESELHGAQARCALHELDHLDGLLILDHLPTSEQRAYQAHL